MEKLGPYLMCSLLQFIKTYLFVNFLISTSTKKVALKPKVSVFETPKFLNCPNDVLTIVKIFHHSKLSKS